MNKCNIFVRIKNYSSISIRNEILSARQPSPFVHLTSFHGYPERVPCADSVSARAWKTWFPTIWLSNEVSDPLSIQFDEMEQTNSHGCPRFPRQVPLPPRQSTTAGTINFTLPTSGHVVSGVHSRTYSRAVTHLWRVFFESNAMEKSNPVDDTFRASWNRRWGFIVIVPRLLVNPWSDDKIW